MARGARLRFVSLVDNPLVCDCRLEEWVAGTAKTMAMPTVTDDDDNDDDDDDNYDDSETRVDIKIVGHWI